MRSLVVAAVLTLSATALAKEEDYGGGMVVFARDHGLWRTDPKGKGPAVQVASLPGASDDVRMIRSDRDGHTLLVDLGGAWWWTRLVDGDVVTPAKLPCADAPARLVEDGSAVICADADGHALIYRLAAGSARSLPVPAAGARVITRDGKRSLIWADDRGVWRAAFANLKKHYRLAPAGPKREFLPAPDGVRAVGLFAGEVYEKKVKVPADVVEGFALDRKAARRMLYRDTTHVLDWSWDSTWILSQDDKYGACITRAIGGEYKCWVGYTAVSLSPDGQWALVLGKRADARSSDDDGQDEEPKGEDGGSDDDEDEAPAEPPAEQHSLYRAKLGGPHSQKPSLVETDIDGTAALWLPGSQTQTD